MPHAIRTLAGRQRGNNTLSDREWPGRSQRLSSTGVDRPDRRNYPSLKNHTNPLPSQEIHFFTLAKYMSAKKLTTFLAVILLHSFLTLYSFIILFGIGHMQAEARPLAPQVIWGCVMLVTWQPALLLTHDMIRVGGRRLFDSYPYPFIFVNSALAVSLGYAGLLTFKRIKIRMKKNYDC